MNYIECSCGGENQNCFRCTGSGLIFAEEDHKPVIKVLLSVAVSNETKNNEESYSYIRKNNQNIELKRCRICDEKIQANYMNDHLLICKPSINQNKQLLNKETQGGIFWKKNKKGCLIPYCKNCRKPTKKDNHSKHLKKCKKRNLSYTKDNQYKDQHLTYESRLIVPRESNDDATKYYAHAFRENGRYGSHPMHDDHDE